MHSLPHWTTVGFTGHRTLPDSSAVQRGIAAALDRLARQFGRLAGISSAASGADTLFLDELQQREIPSFLWLPFPVDRFRQDFTEEDWSRVQPLLDRATHTEVVTDLESDSQAYLETGVLVVDEADVLIAVWNGEPAQGVGGTGEIVAYCRQLNKPLLIIDPQTGTLTEERLPVPIEPAPATHEQLQRAPRELVEQQFRELDESANRHAPQARNLTLRLILLHLFATAIGLTAAIFTEPKAWVMAAGGIKLVVLVGAILLVRWHHHAQHAWLHSRLGAELCRAYLSIWKLRRHRMAEPAVTLPECDALNRSLRILWYVDRSVALELPAARADYQQCRINDQLNYYSSAQVYARRWNDQLRRAALAGTMGAILAAATSILLMIVGIKGLNYQLAKTFALLLPLVSAALLSLIIAQDLGRRANRYRDMADKLRRLSSRIEVVHSWPGLWRVVSETETMLLSEVVEWQTITRVTGESH